MSSLKKYLVLLLVLVLILSFGTAACNWDWLFGPSTPPPDDNGDENGPKFASNVQVVYERISPYVSSDYIDSHVNFNIHATQSVQGWSPIQNATMEKVTEKEFKYTVQSLPYETKLWMYTQDWGRMDAGGPEFNGRWFKIMGNELKDEKFIQKDPWGNNNEVTAFVIKKDNTVVPW